jgi:predicted nucleic-acid-binding Zn-ribbon protein
MPKTSTCPESGHTNLYSTDGVSAGGGYAPNYLPGLGTFFLSAKFTVIACRDCGLTRFFASEEALGKLSDSAKWRKV